MGDNGGGLLGTWLLTLLRYAFILLLAALMLSWAWALLKPLVPVIVIVAVLLLAVSSLTGYLVRRWRSW